MLRRTLGAAALALAAGPAFAADALDYPAEPPPSTSPVYSPTPMVAADVAIAGGYFSGDGGTAEVVANGRVNIPIPWGASWNEELEAAGLWEFNGDYSALGIFSHTYYKDPSWAGGFVLGYSNLSGDSVLTAGVEGAVFLPNGTILGHASYSWMTADVDFWTVAGEGRYYFTPNDRVAGKAVWSNYSGDSDWMLQASYEHRWTGTIFSAFGSLAFFPGPGNWEALVGARAFLDRPDSTLQSHDFDVPFDAARDISY